MKRIFSILLVTALLVGLLPLMSTVAVAESYATVTSTNGYGVRLREGPSKAYGVIGKYNVGTTVIVLQRGSEWSQLQIGSTTGWMMNRYLVYGVTGTPSTGSSGTSAGTNATVISDNGLRVWLRATAGGKRLFLNAVGTGVTVLERGNTWCKVSIGGTVGYMMTKYLSIGNKPSTSSSGKLEGVEINYPSPVVMDTLVATPIPADATVTYQWTVNDVVMGTEREFYVKTIYAGKKIAVTVTGTGAYTGKKSAACSDDVQISKSIKEVALSNANPLVGDKLSAAIKPSSATVEYSWRVGGVEVSNEATYTVTQNDIGKPVQLKVTGIGGYVGSAACSSVTNVASDKAIQSVKLSNVSPVVGEVLSAEVKPSGATVNIAWLANGEVVGKAASYKVGNMDLGKKITVQVTGVEPYTGSALATTNSVASAALTQVKLSNASPVVGDEIYASVLPAGASADYIWKIAGEDGEPVEIGSSSSLLVKEEWAGKAVTVYASGKGIYTGTVSAATKPVISNKQITAVSLTNASPVVGDKITAVVTPKQADASQLTYIWTVDTETASEHGQVYTVADTDVGKRIRVHVIGANEYWGEAYSAYTNPVVDGMNIKGVSILNASAHYNNASSISPEVGHVLVAEVNPGTATVSYQWRANGVDIPAPEGTGRTYTVQPSDKDKRISVYVKGIGNYGKDAVATTARVIQPTPVTVNLIVKEPKAGVKPSYGVSGTNKQCTARLQWMQWVNSSEGSGRWEPAELDAYGTFRPGTVYGAYMTIVPEKGYTMVNPSIKINGQEVETSGYYAVRWFGMTSKLPVTDYILPGVVRPTLSTNGSTNVENSQVTGTIEWPKPTPDELLDLCTATITLSPKDGYTLEDVPANAFKVVGADYGTVYEAGSDTVKAYWTVSHELSIRTDKEQVLLDGYHNSIVQCTADLTNFDGKLKVKWEIVSSDADATQIRGDGTLIVGMNETPGRSLTIRASVKIGEKIIEATKELPVVSGSDTDTQIKISFVKAPTQLMDGESGYYEAIVSNSTEGYELFIIQGDDPWILFDGRLNTKVLKEGTTSFVVRAIANEDHSVVCNTLVEIVKPDPDQGEKASAENSLALANEIMTLDLLAPEDATNNALAPAEGTAPEQQPETEAPAETTAPEQQPETEAPAETTEPEQQPETETPAETTEPEQQPEIEAPAETTEPEQQPETETPAETTEPEQQPETEAPAETTEPEQQPEIEAPAETTAPEQQPETEAPAETTEPEQQPETETPAETTAPEQQPETEAPAETTEPEQQPETEAPAETTEPEQQPETEAPAETTEPEILDDVTITITGEATVPTPVEVEEEPVQDGIVIKDTQTGETVDVITDTPVKETSEQPEEKQEENNEEQPAKKQEPAKKPAAEEETSEEDELDSLEGDDLLGESVESASGIKIVFTKKTSELKRGGSATFAVDVTGSENGVTWSVRRSKDSDGNAVSTISQDGKLTISKAETSDKLIVVATSVDDGTVRARLIVKVTNAATNNAPSNDASGDEPSEGTLIVPTEAETPSEEPSVEEIQPEAEQFTPEQLEQINKEIEQNALENSAANDL